MKRLTCLVAASLTLAIGLSTADAQNTRYFDVNDDILESGVADNTVYPWDTTTPSWNPNADGSGPGPGTTLAWVNGDDAVFSAGIDADGARYGLNISGGATARNVLIENGTVLINGGLYSMTGVTTIVSGATLESKASAQFAGTGALKLSGGTIKGSNPLSAGTLINNLIPWEIDGTGTVIYDNGDGIDDNVVNIINGSVITGTGGTPSNGGAGTLIKRGPDQIGYAPRDLGAGVGSWTLNSFAKLRVEQGTFRIRNATIGGVAGITDERQYGAVPLVVTPDAITLDGGGTGTSTTITLHANRGITIGPNGGFMDNGAGAGLNIPGPLTAAPGSVLTIGSPTSTSASNPAFEFSNAGNSTTFQGNIHMIKSTMRVKSDLTARHFDGTGNSATVFGFLEIGGGNTFTAGTDNLDASFDGRVRDYTGTGGAGTGGIFKWDGTGTLTMNTGTSGEWTNTGGIIINKGTIKFASTNAGFTNTAAAAGVTIAASATLDMNGVNDSFPSLSGAGSVKLDDGGATAGNLTLNGTNAGPITFSGNISKHAATTGGNLTKSGLGSTHILSGTNSVNALAANGGTLVINGTTTASGGAAVGATGALGGTGTIVGAIANSGTIAPGSGGVGTLNVTGNLTNAATGIWSIELSGASADKVAVTGNIDLSAVGDALNVTGAGSGSSWIIGTYTGALTGVFETITSGYSVTYTGGNITLNAAPVGLPGDFNNNGTVDAGDYAVWRKNGNAGTPGASALLNDGGAVDQNARFALWRANFGKPPGAGSGAGLENAAVPEPASFGLVLIGLAAFGFGRRNRVA